MGNSRGAGAYPMGSAMCPSCNSQQPATPDFYCQRCGTPLGTRTLGPTAPYPVDGRSGAHDASALAWPTAAAIGGADRPPTDSSTRPTNVPPPPPGYAAAPTGAVATFPDGKPMFDASGRPASPKNRLAAALLALFLGVLGVHRFYVGKVGTGILMVVTYGGLGIWALIDFIMILVGSFTDKEGRVLSNW